MGRTVGWLFSVVVIQPFSVSPGAAVPTENPTGGIVIVDVRDAKVGVVVGDTEELDDPGVSVVDCVPVADH